MGRRLPFRRAPRGFRARRHLPTAAQHNPAKRQVPAPDPTPCSLSGRGQRPRFCPPPPALVPRALVVRSYCGIDCQRAAWPSHREKCLSYSVVQEAYKQSFDNSEVSRLGGACAPQSASWLLHNTRRRSPLRLRSADPASRLLENARPFAQFGALARWRSTSPAQLDRLPRTRTRTPPRALLGKPYRIPTALYPRRTSRC